MIPFTLPTVSGNEYAYLEEAVKNSHLSGDGPFTKKCHDWFEEKLKVSKTLMTPSCTAALEMAAILIDIQPGDEVIMPSYTFVSTANAFVLRGAKIVFVDIHPSSMNIDERLIESAITDRTKAIVPVHYAGVACEMDTIMKLASSYGLFVIEDAAQGMMSSYKGKALGAIGHIGTYSFHATKNYTSGGEGGLLIINDEALFERAETIREKGTNRSQFIRGKIDKYSWIDIGSSFLPSELQAAYLFAQLEAANTVLTHRMSLWIEYKERLSQLSDKGILSLPNQLVGTIHNAHMFFIKAVDNRTRNELISYLAGRGICTTTHYVPLHSSLYGMSVSRFHGVDNFTTSESEKIVRLPIYHAMNVQMVKYIVDEIEGFYYKVENE